jgi:sulfate transport system permease protein
MLSLFVLIPLASVLVCSLRLSPSAFFEIISDSKVVNAFSTSIICSLIAALINSVFGLILAWTLVRYDFPGKRILDGLIELPFALPTAVAGITLSKMYSNTGEIGGPLSKFGIRISYTHIGLTIALIFIGIPFVVRTVQPVLSKLSPVYEETAYVFGAGPFYSFRRVILPELKGSLLAGFGLALARGIGEYGSVIYISGNSAKEKTQVISYIIMQKLNYTDYEGATAIALIMLIISFLLLLFINTAQILAARRSRGNDDMESGTAKALPASKAAKVINIAISVSFVFIMLVMPLVSVLKNSFSKGVNFYIDTLKTGTVISALKVTLLATVLALLINTIFGLFSSFLLTRFDFKGKRILGALIDIPFSISPVIAGLSFIMMFGRLGWAYPILKKMNALLGTNIKIVFALPGVVLATIFVTSPFISREVIPVLNSVGRDEEEAAAAMGATGFHIFRTITLPHIKWSLIYGMILCTSRALGEFGAVNALSKTRGKTFTLPLEIDAFYMSGDSDSITAAFAVSSILVIIAIVVLVLRSIFERKNHELR